LRRQVANVGRPTRAAFVFAPRFKFEWLDLQSRRPVDGFCLDGDAQNAGKVSDDTQPARLAEIIV
jgi:hypothetical protein